MNRREPKLLSNVVVMDSTLPSAIDNALICEVAGAFPRPVIISLPQEWHGHKPGRPGVTSGQRIFPAATPRRGLQGKVGAIRSGP